MIYGDKMNQMTLSKRLKKIADYVPSRAKLADIGSDHAYLPTYLVQGGKLIKGIAGEINEGPYQSALSHVRSQHFQHMIDVRKGNGLSVIEPGEVNTIVIAGMGGRLISNIIEEGREKLDKYTRLILQPNMAEPIVRQWLMDNNWLIIHEAILEEDEKIYEIIVAEKSNTIVSLTEKELLFGPVLLKECSSVFQKKWHRECQKWEKILASLLTAKPTVETEEKITEFKKKIIYAKEVLE